MTASTSIHALGNSFFQSCRRPRPHSSSSCKFTRCVKGNVVCPIIAAEDINENNGCERALAMPAHLLLTRNQQTDDAAKGCDDRERSARFPWTKIASTLSSPSHLETALRHENSMMQGLDLCENQLKQLNMVECLPECRGHFVRQGEVDTQRSTPVNKFPR